MRYVITGGAGYIGTRLVQHLARREQTERIVVADLKPPRGGYRPKTGFERVDVRDRGRVRAVLESARADVLVHLAFILNPASAAGVEQVLVTSSTSAYGAFPDNPVPLTEEDPVRGVPDFSYARDKAEADRICQLWAAEH